MQQSVIAETARRLKGAGFPMPEPKSGHFWYDGYRNLSVLSVLLQAPGQENKIMVLILDAEDTYETILEEMRGFVFAPTATDILEQLPGWNLAYTKVFGWIVYWDAPGLAEPIQFCHENPAEAAALAWFHEHEKEKQQ